MSTIAVQDVRGLFTKKVIQVLDIKPKPTQFLMSMFKKNIAHSKEISIEVRRHHEFIAADVQRGTGGNYNRFDNSTEKVFVPPYFEEYFFLNELDGYDRIFSDKQEIDGEVFSRMVGMAAEKLELLKYKVMRSYELQCAQVFQTGIVTTIAGDNINFRRQADSMAVLPSNQRWTETSVDPDDTLEEGGRFIRTQGLATGDMYNVIFGANAWKAYLNNPIIQNKADNRRYYNLKDLNSPMMNAEGASYHGTVSAGSYNFNCWTYEQFYNPAGTDKTGKVPYIDSDKIIILPNMPMFNFGYAQVPLIARDMGRSQFPQYIKYQPGDFFMDNYVDPRYKNHIFELMSAGLAIPTQIDAIFSKSVVATS